jgi:hypothetical protein
MRWARVEVGSSSVSVSGSPTRRRSGGCVESCRLRSLPGVQ